ncbi:MAG: tetratricopeptide repeat protein [Smithella sp.]|nr:tetratricopeptide repeat protein [Smithella sp.]
MSYINNALRKVQKDKDSRYTGYEHIVCAPGNQPPRQRRWFVLAGAILFLLFSAGLVTFLYSSAEKKSSGPAVHKTPPAAQTVVARTAPAISSSPAVHPPVSVPPVETRPPIEKSPAVEKHIAKTKTAPAAKAGIDKIKKETDKKTEPAEPVTGIPTVAQEKVSKQDKRSDVQALYAQALKKHQAGDLREAKELYKKVIKMDPHNVQALNNLGVVYMKQKVYKWAEIRLNDALKIKPDYADAHYNLACVYAKTNDTQNSIHRLKDAVKLNPDVKNWVKTDRDLDNVSALPEYQKLMEKQ